MKINTSPIYSFELEYEDSGEIFGVDYEFTCNRAGDDWDIDWIEVFGVEWKKDVEDLDEPFKSEVIEAVNKHISSIDREPEEKTPDDLDD